MHNKVLIIDFDSTLVQCEALEELAQISLAKHPERVQRIKKIADLTDKAMSGEISFSDALIERVMLLELKKNHIEALVKQLKKKITRSFLKNKSVIKKFSKTIYVMSGGFSEYIIPVVKTLGIEADHVYGNTFRWNAKGELAGIDTKNPMSQDGGKLALVNSLKVKEEIIVIGDGFTDMQTKESPKVSKFVAFVENVSRPKVTAGADMIVHSFDEVLYEEQMPMKISYPKSKLKVLLLENVHPKAIALLQAEGFQIETEKKALTPDELKKRIKDVSLLGIRSKTEVTKEVLQASNKLLAIGAFCIGTNQIALEDAATIGVPTFNAPYSNTRSVVELAFGEMIMMLRGVFPLSNAAHQGIWTKSAAGFHEVRSRTLGIIGYGNIGSQLSVLAESFGMRVIFYDIQEKLALGNAQPAKTAAEVFKYADIVTIHVDGRASNKNLIGAKEFALMKKGMIFLNLSRGHIVDLVALKQALVTKQVAAAALDVYPYEPASAEEEFKSDLRGLPNVILTPHIGGSTEEAQAAIGDFVARRFIEYVNNGGTFGAVNFPAIDVPKLKGAHRLLHIHKNVPGVMAQINNIFAKGKINILGQYLKTNEKLGYVITDVNKRYDESVLRELKKIPNTTRFRVLY